MCPFPQFLREKYVAYKLKIKLGSTYSWHSVRLVLFKVCFMFCLMIIYILWIYLFLAQKDMHMITIGTIFILYHGWLIKSFWALFSYGIGLRNQGIFMIVVEVDSRRSGVSRRNELSSNISLFNNLKMGGIPYQII